MRRRDGLATSDPRNRPDLGGGDGVQGGYKKNVTLVTKGVLKRSLKWPQQHDGRNLNRDTESTNLSLTP